MQELLRDFILEILIVNDLLKILFIKNYFNHQDRRTKKHLCMGRHYTRDCFE